MGQTRHRSAGIRAPVRITAISHALGRESVSLEELAREGKLTSTPKTLRGLGFRRIRRANGESAGDLALRAARGLLDKQKLEPGSIDALLFASALPSNGASGRDPIGLFRYQSTRLQNELGLENAMVSAVGQAGCAGLFSAIRVGRALLRSEPATRRVLCLSSDVLPPGSGREILYNVISDGACAVLLERGAGEHRILSCEQVTKGFYWSAKDFRYELIATYFATAANVIRRALERSKTAARDLRLVLPHNVNPRSWEILLDLVPIARGRLHMANLAATGHTIAADPIINLADAMDRGKLRRGDRALLFTFGFGAHWAAMVVER